MMTARAIPSVTIPSWSFVGIAEVAAGAGDDLGDVLEHAHAPVGVHEHVGDEVEREAIVDRDDTRRKVLLTSLVHGLAEHRPLHVDVGVASHQHFPANSAIICMKTM